MIAKSTRFLFYALGCQGPFRSDYGYATIYPGWVGMATLASGQDHTHHDAIGTQKEDTPTLWLMPIAFLHRAALQV